MENPALITIVIDALIKSLLIIGTLLTGFAYTTLLERRWIALLQQRIGPNRAGPFGFLQPAADGVKLFFKEDIIPQNADKFVFTLAPILTAVPALIILAVVPVGDTIEIDLFGFRYTAVLGLADINVAVMYILAVTSISVYGIVLAGWASDNKYAMMGGLRSSAQMISYELAMGLSVLVPVMMVGSMSMNEIVNAQENLWFIFIQPIAGLIFYVTVLAETNRAPFDLPEAEQELTAGYHSEYSGMKFASFFMAEYMKMIAVSAIFASLFLGGYRLSLPLVPETALFLGWPLKHVHDWLWGLGGPLVLFGKVFGSLLLMIWLRATLPRIRYDRLMDLGWKVLLPLALLNLVVTAVLIVAGVIPVFA